MLGLYATIAGLNEHFFERTVRFGVILGAERRGSYCHEHRAATAARNAVTAVEQKLPGARSKHSGNFVGSSSAIATEHQLAVAFDIERSQHIVFLLNGNKVISNHRFFDHRLSCSAT